MDSHNVVMCASDCQVKNCIHSKLNYTIDCDLDLHMWCIPEGIPDCPLRAVREIHDRIWGHQNEHD